MASYKVYGTDESYDGKVVNIAGDLFTTIGGALEGDSKQVIEAGKKENPLSGEDLLPDKDKNLFSDKEDNPVTRTFQAPRSPRYYKSDGTVIPVGYKLHQHADGTIMTEHSMGPGDGSVVVTTGRVANRRRGGGGVTPAGGSAPTDGTGRRGGRSGDGDGPSDMGGY